MNAVPGLTTTGTLTGGMVLVVEGGGVPSQDTNLQQGLEGLSL